MGSVVVVALVVAPLIACGGPAPSPGEGDPSPTKTGQKPAASDAVEATPPTDAAAVCEGNRGERFEDPIELPPRLRIVARMDLADTALSPALEHLERWARGEGAQEGRPEPPIVAGLALSQAGFQVGHLRELLGSLGIAPPELMLFQGPDGEVLWLWRMPCDLEGLRPLVESGWNLRLRTLVRGAIGEPKDPERFPFDLLLLPGERLALVPAGTGHKLLRWLTDGGPQVPGLGPSDDDADLAELLAQLDPAPIRLVVAGKVGASLTLRPGAEGSEPQRVRVTGEGLEISGSVAPSP